MSPRNYDPVAPFRFSKIRIPALAGGGLEASGQLFPAPRGVHEGVAIGPQGGHGGGAHVVGLIQLAAEGARLRGVGAGGQP